MDTAFANRDRGPQFLTKRNFGVSNVTYRITASNFRAE